MDGAEWGETDGDGGGSDDEGFADDAPNRTGGAGQASGRPARRRSLSTLAGLLSAGALAAAVIAPLAACGRHPGEGAQGEDKDCRPPDHASAITGRCLPRYVSLGHDKVYARKGPGMDYPALWTYRANGLPVQIVAETLEWRRICDPYGGAVWVFHTEVEGRRTVFARPGPPIAMLASPTPGAKVAGLLNGGALAGYDRCDGAWCKVRIAGAAGWVAADRIWGVAPAAQCR